MSDQESAPAVAPQPIVAPLYYASSVALAGIPNEVVLTFMRGRPVSGLVDGQQAMIAEPQVMLSLSPATMKDLAVVLAEGVEGYEKEFGEIVTAFTIERSKKAS